MQLTLAEQSFQEAEKIKNQMPIYFDIENKGPGILNQALQKYKEAADLGHLEAMYKFARLSILNYKTIANPKVVVAVEYLKNASTLGHAKAQFDLLRYYFEGRDNLGIKQNIFLAKQLASTINIKELDNQRKTILNEYLTCQLTQNFSHNLYVAAPSNQAKDEPLKASYSSAFKPKY